MNQSVYNPDRTIWSGSKVESIYNSNVSLGYLILSVLKKTPEFVTQVSADTNVEITCVEMRLRTLKIASYLAAAGFKQGDVVGIIASNSENLAPVVFACFTLGLPINPLAPVMTVSDIVYMYSKTKPKAIFCDVTLIETVQKAIEKLPTNPVVYTLSGRAAGFKFVDDILKIDFAEEEFKFPKLTDVSNSTAIILCSSGTTTMPKGVCKSHSQVINQMHSSWNTCELGEVLFNLSSLYWISGVAFLVIGTLYGHQRVITTQAFSPGMMIDIIERFQVTTLFTIPAMVALMLQSNNLSTMMSLRVIISGGAVLAKNLCEAMKQFIPNGIISNIYGVTEGDIVADSFNEQRFGSVGKPSLNVDIKIIDKDGGKLGPNGKGEICYRTKVLFSGYFDDHEMTKETIKNGWVHSGDIGFFDDDGFLFIIDRQKEMLKYNNYHVSSWRALHLVLLKMFYYFQGVPIRARDNHK